MQLLSGIAGAIAGAVAAIAIFFFWVASRKRIAAATVGRAEAEAARLTQEARREAEAAGKETLLTARERSHELLREAETQIRERRSKIADLDKTVADRARALADREASLKRAEASVRERETSVAEQERAAEEEEERCRELAERAKRELQRVSGMTADEAKEILLHQIESDARRDAANLVKRLEHEAREVAADKAKHIITQAIQRSAADHAIETTVSVVDLPSDDLKGRIIGREGRNIRALETATGVELIVDDTPGAIILSSFDPYRREIAKVSIERLIADGRIHPARIEEVVERVRSEVDEAVLKEGEAAAFELGLHDMHLGDLPDDGPALKFRTSYGQNVLAHSKEVAYVAGVMAREVGLDAHTTIRAAFVHDIGKAMDRELEGTHLEIGIDFLKRHGGDALPSSTRWRPTTWTSTGRRSSRCSCRPRTRSRLRGPERDATSSSPTSSAWRSSSTSPTRSRACPRPSPCRPAARSGSWSRATRSPTKRPCGCRRTSRSASRTSSTTPGRSRSP